MIGLLEQTIQHVKNFGEYIPLSELHKAASYETNPDYQIKWSKPLKSKEVVKVLEALIKMLKGEWQSNNADMNFDYDGTLG